MEKTTENAIREIEKALDKLDAELSAMQITLEIWFGVQPQAGNRKPKKGDADAADPFEQ